MTRPTSAMLFGVEVDDNGHAIDEAKFIKKVHRALQDMKNRMKTEDVFDTIKQNFLSEDIKSAEQKTEIMKKSMIRGIGKPIMKTWNGDILDV